MRTILLLLLSFSCFAQHTNKLKNNLRSGKWVEFYDKEKQHIHSKGRYKKGNEKGGWKYYYENGIKQKREVYLFKKIKTTLYYPTGEIWKTGRAKQDETTEKIHYYFYGEWKNYTKEGKLSKIQYYEKGKLIHEKILIAENKIKRNDSLIKQLIELRALRDKSQDSLENTYYKYKSKSKEYASVLKWKKHTDSIINNRTSEFIAKHSYPNKDVIGDEVNTLFYLVSTADQYTKEKHYDLIIKESENGSLDKKDVAYFIDKVLIGKGEPQQYGTQYKFNTKSNTYEYFPIGDAIKVNERRKFVGLDEINWSEIIFINK